MRTDFSIQTDNPCLTKLPQKRSYFAKFFVLLTTLFLSAAFAACDDGGGTQGFEPKFITIPAGSFMMGQEGGNAFNDEKPVHQVTLSAFLICNHKVTQKEYETYCKYGGSETPSDTNGKGDNYPVYFVSWYDAIVYCNLRSKAEGLTPCYSLNNETDVTKWAGIQQEGSASDIKYCGPSSKNTTWDKITLDITADGYRLPTEAEWEYAARGGITDTSNDVWPGTTDSLKVGDYAYYGGQTQTHEVGKKLPNGYGLYDMSGNVREWCWDWYSDSQYTASGVTNPLGAISGSQRVQRGSGIDSYDVKFLRASCRSSADQYGRFNGLGFRLVRSAQ